MLFLINLIVKDFIFQNKNYIKYYFNYLFTQSNDFINKNS